MALRLLRPQEGLARGINVRDLVDGEPAGPALTEPPLGVVGPDR